MGARMAKTVAVPLLLPAILVLPVTQAEARFPIRPMFCRVSMERRIPLLLRKMKLAR